MSVVKTFIYLRNRLQ